MASEGGGFLIEAATYLGAAAIAVPVFNRLKLGSILGYLAAGVVIGPSGLNILDQEEGVFHVAELGVVLFLFLIGLELSLARLFALRRDIFGLGLAQMALTGAVIAGIFFALDVAAPTTSIVAGLTFAFSSTAFALQFMKDRGDLNTPYGKRAFPVLLFQDLAVIPLLAVLPFLAAGGAIPADVGGASIWLGLSKAAGVVAVLILIGKYVIDHVLRLVAASGSHEAFAATALFIVAAVATAVAWAGLSMALGAFLAGVLLAESSYRHQIQTDIEPFRGLLLGLFFISIGMRLDLGAIADAWLLVIGGAVGLVFIKTAVLSLLARAFGSDWSDAIKAGAVLSQGGEFAFVVFSLGLSTNLFTDNQATLMSAIVTLSMIMTPFAVMLASRATPAQAAADDGDLEGPQAGHGHVIVAGFGRMGQIISQVLGGAGLSVTAIDKDPQHIQNAKRYGFKVYYGDASRLDVLMTAGAEDASAIILTMDDSTAVIHAVESLRSRLPNAEILVVAHDRLHEIELRPLDPSFLVRETMESSLLIARETLKRVNVPDALIDDYVEQFRTIDRERLLAQMDQGPEGGKHMLHQRFSTPQSQE